MKQIHLSVTEDILRRIAVIAKMERRSVSSLIEVILREYLEKKGL